MVGRGVILICSGVYEHGIIISKAPEWQMRLLLKHLVNVSPFLCCHLEEIHDQG